MDQEDRIQTENNAQDEINLYYLNIEIEMEID